MSVCTLQVWQIPQRITLVTLMLERACMGVQRLDARIHGSERGVNLHARPRRGASPAQMMAGACASRCTASSSVSSFAMPMLVPSTGELCSGALGPGAPLFLPLAVR